MNSNMLSEEYSLKISSVWVHYDLSKHNVLKIFFHSKEQTHYISLGLKIHGVELGVFPNWTVLPPAGDSWGPWILSHLGSVAYYLKHKKYQIYI